MKKISVVIMIVWMSCSVFSQDLYMGFRTGFKQEVFSSKYDMYKTKIDFKAPTLALYYSVTFPNNFEIRWGSGYYAYSQNVNIYYWDDVIKKEIDCQTGHIILFHSFFNKFQIGYNLKLAKDFNLKFNMGVSNEFYLQPGSYDPSKSIKISKASSPEVFINYSHILWKPFNFMLSNSLSFQYFTKHNIGISVFAAYHTGLLQVTNTYITFKENKYIITDVLATRGSYFEFGLELGYRYKRLSPKK